MDEPEGRPAYRVLSTRTIALAALALVLVGVGMATWLLVAYGNGNTGDSTKLDAIRTAGTIVVGTGGAGALWLAARRQRTSEIALKQKDRDHKLAEYDAAERRVTELYTKAADQLGSDKAPVRLAGMYALERLAQGNPTHRQTVVNVLCAYLRMPYVPPQPEVSTLEGVHATGEEHERREQERQVRLTAQRILAAHLHRGYDPDHTASTFWRDIDLDLTGATLLDFDLDKCHIRNAIFSDAQFSGKAKFGRARFTGIVLFSRAQFGGDARFDKAHFNGAPGFDEARFQRNVAFVDARFMGGASFFEAQFSRTASFNNAEFGGTAMFNEAWFRGDVLFGDVRFIVDAHFDRVRFEGDVIFSAPQFTSGNAFAGARVRLDANVSSVRAWPSGYILTDPDSDADGTLSGHDGRWGYLTYVAEDAPSPRQQPI